jgi:hypothetical protein
MGTNNLLRPHPLVKSQQFNQFYVRKLSKSVVHETRVYSARVGPKGSTLEKFPDIKMYIYSKKNTL